MAAERMNIGLQVRDEGGQPLEPVKVIEVENRDVSNIQICHVQGQYDYHIKSCCSHDSAIRKVKQSWGLKEITGIRDMGTKMFRVTGIK